MAVALLSFLSVAAGCSAADSSETDSTTNAYSSEPSATPDIPVFTAADRVEHYVGRMRVSVGSGAFTESEVMGSVDSSNRSAPKRFAISESQLRPGTTSWAVIDFGQPGDLTMKPGTYSCTAGDARVSLLAYTGSLTVQNAATCSVIIDQVSATNYSPEYVRVYGRFTAESNLPDRLPSALRGAFVADAPLPVVVH